MTESPWPESRRTQRALFVAGGVALLASLLGVAEVLPLGGTVTVLAATAASALLIYGLLGAVGRWFDEEPAEDVVAGDEAAGTGANDAVDGGSDEAGDGDAGAADGA